MRMRQILTRTSKITCLYFGVNRRREYPDSFFCSNCDWLEQALASGAKVTERHQNSRRYRCRANHTQPTQPSHKRRRPAWLCQLIDDEDSEASEEDDNGGASEDNDDATTIADDQTTNEEEETGTADSEIEKLGREVGLLRERLRCAQIELATAKSQNVPDQQQALSLARGFVGLIDRLSSGRIGNKKAAKIMRG
jgi:hypothetical protein